MRGLRADLVLFTLIVSVIVHLAVMYYARPRVMIRASSAARASARHVTLRVRPAEEEKALPRIESLPARASEKAAPTRDETLSLAPAPETALPEETLPLDLPPIAAPSETRAVTSWLPDLPLEDVTQKRPDVAPAAPSWTSAPITETPTPAPSDVAFLPTLVVTDSPGAWPAPSTTLATLPKAERVPFVATSEVMESVDRARVEAEKAAVRALVDSPRARDLASVVTLSLEKVTRANETYFRVRVEPTAALEVVPKDVVILIDASGSIGRERMGSIRGAAKRLLRSAANTSDRFNLVAFRDRYTYAFRAWQPCTEATFAAADSWISNVAPFGRTDVFSTISSVLTLPRDPARPLIALVVTDGDANEGVSETAEILSAFTALNDGLISIYIYGVRNAANRTLIDALTRGNRGESVYFHEENWFSRAHVGEGLEGLSNRFRDPVLTDLRLVFASRTEAEAYPTHLKNLYRGDRLEIVGKVPKGTTEIAFSLKGLHASEAYEAFFRVPLDGAREDESIEKDWLEERRINGIILKKNEGERK